MFVFRLVGSLFDWLYALLIDSLYGWLLYCSGDCWLDRMVDCLFVCLFTSSLYCFDAVSSIVWWIVCLIIIVCVSSCLFHWFVRLLFDRSIVVLVAWWFLWLFDLISG